MTCAWVAFAVLALWVVHRAILGELDFTVINLKAQFVPRAFAVVAISAGASAAVHAAVVRRLPHLVSDALTLLGLLLVVNLGHGYVYGWPLGFPLPPAAARYLPFFGAIAVVGYALFALLLVVIAHKRARSRRATSSSASASSPG